MSRVTVPRPGRDEAAPFYHGYIAAVPDEQIGVHLVAQLGELDGLLAPLSDSAALMRYATGKWSVNEVVGHLVDAERVFTYRLLRVSRGDSTPLPGFDENAYVAAGHFDERPVAALRAEFRAVRLSTVELVAGVAPESWSRRGQANGLPISARALGYIIVGHVAHHMAVLRERYGLGASTPS